MQRQSHVAETNESTPMAEHPLTGKQQLFVAEYLADLNATRAAIRAGYSGSNASTTGWRNLRNPKIRAAIAEAQAPRLAGLDMDAEAVIAELAKIARASVLDYMRVGEDGEATVDLGRLSQDNAGAIANVTVDHFKRARGDDKSQIRRIRISFHNKIAALQALAKHFELLRERAAAEQREGSGHEPEHDPRQVARAVIAILESAAVAEEEDDVA